MSKWKPIQETPFYDPKAAEKTGHIVPDPTPAERAAEWAQERIALLESELGPCAEDEKRDIIAELSKAYLVGRRDGENAERERCAGIIEAEGKARWEMSLAESVDVSEYNRARAHACVALLCTIRAPGLNGDSTP